MNGHDERNQTGILTWDFNLAPAFPRRSCIDERSSGYWEFVVRYSGATVPDFHRIP